MRRAIRHGRLLGANKPFLFEMVQTVRQLMGGAYPELLEASASRVPEIVLAEEKRFLQTLDIGLRKLEEELRRLIRDHPTRERLRGQLMRALYLNGQQAEALEVYRDFRSVLRDELGYGDAEIDELRQAGVIDRRSEPRG